MARGGAGEQQIELVEIRLSGYCGNARMCGIGRHGPEFDVKHQLCKGGRS
jgi:hypothetical protein